MRHIFIFFQILLFATTSIFSQNTLIQVFHPQYHELIPLVTDSMYIYEKRPDGMELTRAVGIRYPDGLPAAWREIRTQSNPTHVWKSDRFSAFEAGGLSSYNVFIDTIRMDTIKTRRIAMGADATMPDSTIDEIWSAGQWIPTQKSIYYYSNQKKVLKASDFVWDKATETWENASATGLQYDNQQRLLFKEVQNWNTDIWVSQISYKYSYRPNESAPKCLVYAVGGVTFDSTVTWYDLQGREDSSKIFQWNGFLNQWAPVSKRILADSEAKKALAGNFYAGEIDAASTTHWAPKERREFLEGNNIYTDEPQEETVQTFNPTDQSWNEKWRRSISYSALPDGRILGSIKIMELGKDSVWGQTFSAEAWFHLSPDSLHWAPPKDRSEIFTLSSNCGFNNPYTPNQTVSFPASDISGAYELKIYSEDSRLIFQQKYDSFGSANINASLYPGLYFVTIKKGGVLLCTQKMMVH